MFYRRIAIVATLLALFLTVFALGMQSGARQDQAFHFFRAVKQFWLPPKPAPERLYRLNEWAQLIEYRDKQVVPRPPLTPETWVIFTFGQSNSANHGGERFIQSSDKLLNFWDGQFYVASDPLLGATGFAGSMWTHMGQQLIQQGMTDQVILLSAGVGLTQVSDWQPQGKLHAMLIQRLQEAQAHGLTITHFLWHQGESDHGTPPEAYQQGLQQVIDTTQRYFPKSKFVVAQASMCQERTSDPALIQAQLAVTRRPGVYLGPNTDSISRADRYDDCHFSGRGLSRAAQGWVDALAAAEKQKAQPR